MTAGGTLLASVTFNGTNFVFDAGAGASGNVPGTAGWNLVEMAWIGGTSMDYWVNADSTSTAATGSVTAAAGTMESVVLGAVSTIDGSLTFDSYEARRLSPVGALTMGDANSDDAINILDIGVITSEILLTGLGQGQPDCNSDASVNILDIGCATNIILSAP